MADTTLSFRNGQTFSPTGQALNSAAQQGLTDLGISGNSYSNYVPPNVNSAIPSSELTAPSLNLPTGTLPDNGSSLVAGVISGQNASQGSTNTPSALDQATNDYNSAGKSYKDLITNSPDESKMFTDIENQAGLPGQKSHIDQLKTELANLTASYNNQYQAIGARGVESGTPAVFYQGEQAAQQRQASVVIAGKSAVLAALQGNYNEAESLAKQTADMQFKAAEDKIKNAYDFLKLNEDTLTKAQANTIKTNTATQKVQLDAQKTNVKTALTSGVQTTFWTKPNGTVVRTNDGYEFKNPDEAFAAGVLPDFSNAPKINPVGKSETRKIGSQTYHIVYDQAGNVLSKTALNGSNSSNPTNTPVPTPAKLKAIHNQNDQILATMTGKAKGDPNGDNYVSPETFNQAADTFVQAKQGTYAQFYNAHKGFANPIDVKRGYIKK
jgi:hypothetical protein